MAKVLCPSLTTKYPPPTKIVPRMNEKHILLSKFLGEYPTDLSEPFHFFKVLIPEPLMLHVSSWKKTKDKSLATGISATVLLGLEIKAKLLHIANLSPVIKASTAFSCSRSIHNILAGWGGVQSVATLFPCNAVSPETRARGYFNAVGQVGCGILQAQKALIKFLLHGNNATKWHKANHFVWPLLLLPVLILRPCQGPCICFL